jgi:endonuclease III
VRHTLLRAYGQQRLGNKGDPFEELIYILLSSRTPPDRCQRVYARLRRVYRKRSSLADADPRQVTEVIADAGLQNRRARALVEIARLLRSEFGRVTLSPLKAWPDDQAEAFLTSLPGVSTKTARCVMMYSLARAVFPVDSHCFRVAKRLRWIPEDANLTSTLADALQTGVPPAQRHDLHVGLVLLGRDVCTPSEPACPRCPIRNYCPSQKLA